MSVTLSKRCQAFCLASCGSKLQYDSSSVAGYLHRFQAKLLQCLRRPTVIPKSSLSKFSPVYHAELWPIFIWS